MATLAGKTSTNRAAVAHPATHRVRGTSRPTAHANSPTPLRRTQKPGTPRKRGTIDSNPCGNTKCSVPVVSSSAARTTAAALTRTAGVITRFCDRYGSV